MDETNEDRTSRALDVVVLAQDETKIWHGLPDRATQHGNPTKPHLVKAPDRHGQHRHVRLGQAHHMHHIDRDDPKYFDAIASRLRGAERILLVGHAHGRSSMVNGFMARVRDRHPDVARRVIGEVSVNLPAHTEPEILEVARGWYTRYCKRERT